MEEKKLKKFRSRCTVESNIAPISFEIQDVPRVMENGYINHHRNRLVINVEKEGKRSSLVIEPSNYNQGIFANWSMLNNISVVQILPKEGRPNRLRKVYENDNVQSYALFLGTGNNCCDGAVLSGYLNLVEKLDNLWLEGEIKSGVNVPFNVYGLLGTENYAGMAIASGSGCSGRGVKLINLNKKFYKDILSEQEADKLWDKETEDFLGERPIISENGLIIPSRNSKLEVNISELFKEKYDYEGLMEYIIRDASKSCFLYAEK